MPFVVADRVRETTTSTGTGTITLSGTAPTGFQTFGTGIGNANNTFYTIAGGSEWEVGIGTYTAVGTTLSRDTVLASSAGGTTKVTFSAGTKDVFVTYPAGRSVYQEGSFNAALGSVTAPSHSFVGDTNTGMFSPAADTLAFAEGGIEVMRITAAGNVGIGTISPGQKLTVAGTIETTSGGVRYPDGTTQTTAVLEKVDVYSTVGSTTWTKPSWAVTVEVIVIGGGSGGGSGRKGAAGSARNGGAGGNGGTYTVATFPASLLTSTVTVTVGGGGAGGASVTTNDTNGNVGGVGGASSFGTYAYAMATRAATQWDSIGNASFGSFQANTGAFGSTAGATPTGITTAPNLMGPMGGAAGGFINASNVVGGGGQGVNTTQGTAQWWKTGVYVIPAANFNAGAGPSGTNNSTSIWYGGESGSGGGASSTGNAFSGGNGGRWGGGGGGGGSALNNVGNSGAGGNGGDGVVIVISRG